MTQYMLSVHGTADEATYPTEEEAQQAYADTGRFNEKLQEAGVWVFAGGLQPIEQATVVDGGEEGTAEKPIITDGPFAEAKEFLGGFWIIEAPDLDAALKWAAEGSAACRGKVEVRPFQSGPE